MNDAWSAFKEDDGKWSFSRLSCAWVLVWAHIWVTMDMIMEHKIPELMGVTGYVAATLGVLYGSNKIAAAITDKQQQ